jgi:hypothetical protein
MKRSVKMTVKLRVHGWKKRKRRRRRRRVKGCWGTGGGSSRGVL